MRLKKRSTRLRALSRCFEKQTGSRRLALGLERSLDDNEAAQRRSQAEQDGSEVRSVDLERLTAQGLTLIEKRNAFEFLRDAAAERFAVETGSAWRLRSGSKVNHRALTSAVIDSRDFVNARRRAEQIVLVPEGQRIAFRRRRRVQRPPAHLGGARQGAHAPS